MLALALELGPERRQPGPARLTPARPYTASPARPAAVTKTAAKTRTSANDFRASSGVCGWTTMRRTSPVADASPAYTADRGPGAAEAVTATRPVTRSCSDPGPRSLTKPNKQRLQRKLPPIPSSAALAGSPSQFLMAMGQDANPSARRLMRRLMNSDSESPGTPEVDHQHQHQPVRGDRTPAAAAAAQATPSPAPKYRSMPSTGRFIGYSGMPLDRYTLDLDCALGGGHFSDVLKATPTGFPGGPPSGPVAIKVLRDTEAFGNVGWAEAEMLAHVGRHPAVISLVDNFTFHGHVCLVFPLQTTSLHAATRAHGMDVATTVRCASDLLGALTHLKACGVLHCDIKPENVTLNAVTGGFTLIDFGSSAVDPRWAPAGDVLRTYEHLDLIQSRWFRAPEAVFRLRRRFGPATDIWSLACTLYEALTGYPLFPGDDEPDQVSRIIACLGLPPTRLVRYAYDAGTSALLPLSATNKVCQANGGDDGDRMSYRVYIDGDDTSDDSSAKGSATGGQPAANPTPAAQTVNRYLRSVLRRTRGGPVEPPQHLVSFLLKMLRWMPEDRFTAEQLLQHPFLRA